MKGTVINHEKLKNSLRNLATLQINLSGNEEENDCMEFESNFKTQDEILKIFQLPLKTEYYKLLWFKGLPDDILLEQRIAKLHLAAKEYLLSPVITEIELLNDAKERGDSSFDILPELNIETHVYNVFVYNKIFLRGKDSAEDVLRELRLANEEENLNMLGRLAMKTLDNDCIFQLKQKGINYINEFMWYNSDILNEDGF